MPTIRTRSAKGSALTQAEADANFKKTVRQVTTTAATLISDNRGVVEGNHATTPFTITLLAVATAAAAEPGDYSVTISNIGAAAVTVDANGSETINGSTDTLTLAQYSSVRLEVDSAGTGWQITARTGDLGAVTVGAVTGSGAVSIDDTTDSTSGTTGSIHTDGGIGAVKDIATDANIVVGGTVDGRDVAADGAILDAIGVQNVKLNTKVVDIGDWNMNVSASGTSSVNVAHGLTLSTIRGIQVIIRADGAAALRSFGDFTALASQDLGEQVQIDSTNVTLSSPTSSIYDNSTFDATSFNRGWIIIQYTD